MWKRRGIQPWMIGGGHTVRTVGFTGGQAGREGHLRNRDKSRGRAPRTELKAEPSEQPLNRNCPCTVTHHSGRCTGRRRRSRPTSGPAGARGVPAVLRGQAVRRGAGAYIKEHIDNGLYKVYDRTGTYLGEATRRTVGDLFRTGWVIRRYEDETYNCYSAKEDVE